MSPNPKLKQFIDFDTEEVTSPGNSRNEERAERTRKLNAAYEKRNATIEEYRARMAKARAHLAHANELRNTTLRQKLTLEHEVRAAGRVTDMAQLAELAQKQAKVETLSEALRTYETQAREHEEHIADADLDRVSVLALIDVEIEELGGQLTARQPAAEA